MSHIAFHRDRAVVQLHGAIDEETTGALVGALRRAHEEYFYDRIEISVRSQGGSLGGLRETLHEIRRLRSLDVRVDTAVQGLAGDAGAVLTVLGDRRRAAIGSQLRLDLPRMDASSLTARTAAIAGYALARQDQQLIGELTDRGLRATPPTGGTTEDIEAPDWHVVARLVSAPPPPVTGEPDTAQRRDLRKRLRRTVRRLVSEQDRPGLMSLYAILFEQGNWIGTGLARELLLIDTIGDDADTVAGADGESCLHVPEWRSLWPGGFVPARFLCRHTLILGETGSGKTLSGIAPMLKALVAPELPDGTVGCALVVDPKKELWDRAALADRGARLIDLGGAGGPAVNLMAGPDLDVSGDIAAGRYLDAAERILVRSASLTRLSPANALAGRPTGGRDQYWQTEGARMATSALALTLALLDNSAAVFAGGAADHISGLGPDARRALMAFGERAGLLMPHRELEVAARKTLDRLSSVDATEGDDDEQAAFVVSCWEAFRAAVEASAIHAALPALRGELRTRDRVLRESPTPADLRGCVRATMAATLTQLPDDRLQPAPGVLALADATMKLMFGAAASDAAAVGLLYDVKRGQGGLPPALRYLEVGLDELEDEEEDLRGLPHPALLSMRQRLRIALNRLEDLETGHLKSGDGSRIAAGAVVRALCAVCDRPELDALRESVDHWCMLGGGERNLHYIGVQAFACLAFFEFTAPAAA